MRILVLAFIQAAGALGPSRDAGDRHVLAPQESLPVWLRLRPLILASPSRDKVEKETERIEHR